MKPVFSNSFLVVVNPNGECVLNQYHHYPETAVDATTSQVMLTGKSVSELVSSVVMSNENAKALSAVLSNTLATVDKQQEEATRQQEAKGGGMS